MNRRIVCAAVTYPAHPGTVLVGPRHFDAVMVAQYQRIFGEGEEPEDVQGFIDQHGKFLTREEAWFVALAEGQVIRRVGGDSANGGRLYSENLY